MTDNQGGVGDEEEERDGECQRVGWRRSGRLIQSSEMGTPRMLRGWSEDGNTATIAQYIAEQKEMHGIS